MIESQKHDELEQLLTQGIEAIKSNKLAEARELLARAIQLQPTDDRLWLWMSGAVETDLDRRRCLERVLQLNPQNEAARRGLAALSRPQRAAQPSEHAAPSHRPAMLQPTAQPVEAPPPLAPPVRVADPAELNQPATPQPVAAANPPQSSSSTPPLLRRIGQHTSATANGATETRSDMQTMSDLNKLRAVSTAAQPKGIRRYLPVILAAIGLIVIIALAVMFMP